MVGDVQKSILSTIFVVTGNNLGSHYIGGFLESFSGFRICRFCMATKDQIQDCFDIDQYLPQIEESYNSQLALVEKKS